MTVAEDLQRIVQSGEAAARGEAVPDLHQGLRDAMTRVAQTRALELGVALSNLNRLPRPAFLPSSLGVLLDVGLSALIDTPGLEPASTALRFLSRARAAPYPHEGLPLACALLETLRCRTSLVLLARAQPPDVLRELLREDKRHTSAAEPELVYLLAHEALAQPSTPITDAEVRWLRDEAEASGHPLSVLPLRPTPFERRALDEGLLGFPAGFDAREQPVTSWLAPLATDVTTSELRVSMAAAVRHSHRLTGGRLELRAYSLQELPRMPDLLFALSSPALSGATWVRWSAIPAVQAWGTLLHEARDGAEYNPGMGTGHSRLAAWTSLAGMMGVLASDGVAALEAAADSMQWFFFDSDGAGFERVVHDTGLLCVDPARRRASLLAFSTSD